MGVVVDRESGVCQVGFGSAELGAGPTPPDYRGLTTLRQLELCLTKMIRRGIAAFRRAVPRYKVPQTTMIDPPDPEFASPATTLDVAVPGSGQSQTDASGSVLAFQRLIPFVRGRVWRSKSGRPAKAVAVRIHADGGAVLAWVQTDANGIFEWRDPDVVMLFPTGSARPPGATTSTSRLASAGRASV